MLAIAAILTGFILLGDLPGVVAHQTEVVVHFCLGAAIVFAIMHPRRRANSSQPAAKDSGTLDE